MVTCYHRSLLERLPDIFVIFIIFSQFLFSKPTVYISPLATNLAYSEPWGGTLTSRSCGPRRCLGISVGGRGAPNRPGSRYPSQPTHPETISRTTYPATFFFFHQVLITHHLPGNLFFFHQVPIPPHPPRHKFFFTPIPNHAPPTRQLRRPTSAAAAAAAAAGRTSAAPNFQCTW